MYSTERSITDVEPILLELSLNGIYIVEIS